MQLRFWMKSSASTPSPAQTKRALAYFMASFAQNLDSEQAAQTRFTAVLEFSSSGGAAWTLEVMENACRVSEGRAVSADLVMIQSPETFLKTRSGIDDLKLALLKGEIKVYGLRNLATFEQLFPIKSLEFAPLPVDTHETRLAVEADLLMHANAA